MRISFVLASILTVAAMATPAFAEDGKHYPGLECKANNASTIYSAGRIFNTSPEANGLFCPVVRDVAGSDGIQSARVYVIDQDGAAGSNVSCSLYRRSSFTAEAFDWSTAQSAGSLQTAQELNLGEVKGAPGMSYYELRCTVPGADAPAVGRSGVVSYSVTEL